MVGRREHLTVSASMSGVQTMETTLVFRHHHLFVSQLEWRLSVDSVQRHPLQSHCGVHVRFGKDEDAAVPHAALGYSAQPDVVHFVVE